MNIIISFLLISFCLNASSIESYLYDSNPQLKTEAFKVIKNKKVLFDKSSIDNKKKFILWSMSKSITSLLIGIAQDKGFLNINDKISKYLKVSDDKKNITIRHLLEMSSGIRWEEIYDASPFRSHVVDMLYNSKIRSMGSYALKQPLKNEPGTKFNYSSGDTNILNIILKEVLKNKNDKSYPWDWLFDPLEIADASFEMDQEGSFIGSSYVYLSLESLLKIGQLILDKGIYQGHRVLSEDYINYATSLSKSMESSYCLRDHKRNYGAQFWLNAKCPNGKKPFPKVSDDTVLFLGYSGQNLILFPSRNAMAVRFASDKHGALDLGKYLFLIEKKLDEN